LRCRADVTFLNSKTERFLELYKELEIIRQETSRLLRWEVIPWKFGTIVACFGLCFICVAKSSFGISMTVFNWFGFLACMVTLFVLQAAWTFSEEMRGILEDCRHGEREPILKRRLFSCSHLNIRFGRFFPIDRDAFIFYGNLCVSNTVNLLLF